MLVRVAFPWINVTAGGEYGPETDKTFAEQGEGCFGGFWWVWGWGW